MTRSRLGRALAGDFADGAWVVELGPVEDLDTEELDALIKDLKKILDENKKKETPASRPSLHAGGARDAKFPLAEVRIHPLQLPYCLNPGELHRVRGPVVGSAPRQKQKRCARR